jgi:hypothetical protein
MNQHCHSCAAPLTPDFKGASDRYCKYCSDPSGKLHPKDQVQKGISMWLKQWQPGLTEKQAADRAAHYMRAMPAWAES